MCIAANDYLAWVLRRLLFGFQWRELLTFTLSRVLLFLSQVSDGRPLGDASLSSLVNARQCISAESKGVDVCFVHAHSFVIAALIWALVFCANNTRFLRRFCTLTERLCLSSSPQACWREA